VLSFNKDGDTHQIVIEGDMTIYQASELKTQLIDALNQAETLDIDLSHVSKIDSTGIQLLMLAKKHHALNGKPLSFSNHSEAVLDAFEMMGLTSWFNDPVVITRTGQGR
jgi:anti-anti-sigma factor